MNEDKRSYYKKKNYFALIKNYPFNKIINNVNKIINKTTN